MGSTEAIISGHKGSRIWSFQFVRIALLSLCVTTFGQCNIVGTPLFIVASGGNAFYSGVLVAVFSFSAILSRFVSGSAADRYSRRLVVVVGSVVLLIGSLLPLISQDVPIQICSRILTGLGFAANHTSASACAADVLPRERLGEGLGYFGLGQALGLATGPALAIWLTGLGYSESLTVGFTAIGFVMLMLGISIRYEKNPMRLPESSGYRQRWLAAQDTGGEEGQVLEAKGSPTQEAAPPMPERHSFMGRFFERRALRGAVPMLFCSAGIAVFISYAALYATSLGYANPGSFFLVSAACAVVLRLTSSKLMDRIPPQVILLCAMAAGIISLLGVYFIHNEYLYYVFGVGYGICFGFSMPLFVAVAVKASPSNRWGAANALVFLMNDIGVGGGVMVWGLLFDSSGFFPVFFGGAALFAITILCGYLLFPKKERA